MVQVSSSSSSSNTQVLPSKEPADPNSNKNKTGMSPKETLLDSYEGTTLEDLKSDFKAAKEVAQGVVALARWSYGASKKAKRLFVKLGNLFDD